MEDESIDAFNTRLRKLASNCEFQEPEREILHQIIQTCRIKQLRIKALQESPSLSQLLAMGRSMEISAMQAKEMENRETVYATSHKKKMDTKKSCFKCGGEFPHKDKCPALGKTCNKCGKKNHFANMCKTSRDKIHYNEEKDNSDDQDSDDDF